MLVWKEPSDYRHAVNQRQVHHLFHGSVVGSCQNRTSEHVLHVHAHFHLKGDVDSIFPYPF